MEYEQIKKLMEDMGNSKLTDISIEFPDGIKISMKKDSGNVVVAKEITVSNEVITQEETKSDSLDEKSDIKEDNSKFMKSPMVGTFYAKPSPESEPYVKVGQKVKKGDILCIIEAMKLLNEIESEFDGTIEEILVNDGEMVDFGKPLFKIK